MPEGTPTCGGEEPADRLVREDDAELSGGGRARALLSSRRSFAWALLLTLLLIGVSLFWLASEAHYRGCVEAVSVKSQGDNSSLARLDRRSGVKGCGRSPF